MSTSKLETFVPKAGVGKPRSRIGSWWDRFRKPTTEPPYRQLPEYHIRVVKIKPGTAQYPLRVKLQVVDPRNFKYLALSYTWDTDDNAQSGPADVGTGTATILCGGTPVKVRPNLYNALCQIRDVQSDLPVFVDALCINFASNAERTAYLEIMGHVYARAASVIVYLGPKTAQTDEVVLIMRKLVNAIDWRKITNSSAYNFHDPSLFEQLGMETPTVNQWRQIHAFCHMRWFTRRWAFFELALAKQALFLWGECCMEYNFLIDFGMILGLSGWLDELQHISAGVGVQNVAGLTKMLGPVARLRNVPPWHPKHGDYVKWMRNEYGLETDVQRAWKFFEILVQSSAAFECRDLRDLLYAPLAFARMVFAGHPINKQWPRADYGTRAPEVVEQFRFLIQQNTGQPSSLVDVHFQERDNPGNAGYYEERGRKSRRRLSLR